MWFSLSKYFGRFPSQGKVAKLLLTNGMCVKGGRVYSGEVEVADMALARAAGVDRRIVRAAVETIEAEDELRQVFSALIPTAMLKEVAPVMGWGCIEIIPTDAAAPGILADVTRIIAEAGISVRQALVDDPDISEEPRLYVITDSTVPPEMIPRIKSSRGVKSLLIH
ncbi:ACT domain-containing protein [Methanomassiliicoccus luminyensis]|jgi:predicted regulator of amino acid metabolism with ACT domain|uniref:ACT domain-containing protein n=1 Tax=Methanomassiliicoccus luminyensis TaxID=1080712 RepID=UPI0004749678|nr:ACT domain-containing protein [Methanomassiliicoccus luminyensis]